MSPSLHACVHDWPLRFAVCGPHARKNNHNNNEQNRCVWVGGEKKSRKYENTDPRSDSVLRALGRHISNEFPHMLFRLFMKIHLIVFDTQKRIFVRAANGFVAAPPSVGKQAFKTNKKISRVSLQVIAKLFSGQSDVRACGGACFVFF